ncbi:MAG TPA: prepilin-type cleavage/methylation domain-containing protein [Cyanobacteria bacterium UBA12227]|nr:prepilin-type cleavage/methylation domain-containing protein [Cyanobacteria bacterium UBA12227]HAX89496.1 prepilin-type cleavage/methylation domain-containing protein [Cyanobacteria bacterium UBA11370]HBY81622.1 prepilin-type cleavage/methylation domain-containing protein [Cyanobacteria bacterium UBA11148]
MMRTKPQNNHSRSTESGFTIIESLMAVVVASILMIAIAPVLALSVATRVQAKRVELASLAAKSYLDGVRSGTIPAPPISNTELTNIAAPSGSSLNCDNQEYCNTNLYCIDGDGDNRCTNTSLKDMVVQAAGYHPAPTGATNEEMAEKGYLLGLRVYRADAFSSDTEEFLPGVGSEGTAASFAGGTGLNKKVPPLVKMTTEIMTNGEDGTTFKDLCERIAIAQGKTATEAAQSCN